MTFLSLLVGLVLLGVGTEMVIRGVTGISQRFNLAPVFIGATLVAFGTDLPELLVAIQGALAKTDMSDLIVGNALGSCVCQITLVSGSIFLMLSGKRGQGIDRINILWLICSICLLLVLAVDNHFSRIEGVVLLLAFGVFLIQMLNHRTAVAEEDEIEIGSTRLPGIYHLPLLIFLVSAGLLIVFYGAEKTVHSAIQFSASMGISQALVGAVILAIGTSLPELAISIGAIIRNQAGLSIGNVIGSNIFDTLVPIGTAATISSVRMDGAFFWLEIPFLLVGSGLFIGAATIRNVSSKLIGTLMLSVFFTYVIVRALMG